MNQNDDLEGEDYRVGAKVVVTEPTEMMEEQGTEVVGEVGTVDLQLDDNRYLVIFSGGRGWYVPPANLREATDEEKREARRDW